MALRIKGSAPLKSMGIDPSTAATGIVVLQENGTKVPSLLFQTELKGVGSGLSRAINITKDMMSLVRSWRPDRIVIEGYSLNMKNASSVIPLVELGTLLRLYIKLDGLKWSDPRATELKKFVCGKGTVPKDQMILQVFKRWAFEAETNNLADAFGLACMGLAMSGRLPGLTLEMQKIAGAMAIQSN